MTQWTPLPGWLHSLVARTPGSILLQTSRFDASNHRSLLFLNAERTIAAHRLDELPGLFQQVEEALAAGLHVAGYVGYECGYHFERFAAIPLTLGDLPLAWFGVYQAPIVYNHRDGTFKDSSKLPQTGEAPRQNLQPFPGPVNLQISKEDYGAKISRIQQYIASGDTYQVNFTDQVSLSTSLSPDAVFSTLLDRQPVSYSAFLNVAGKHILSLSPELFFRIEDGKITTRPMKGTMPRGMDNSEDIAAAIRLQGDEKNRSEHVMIVDLLRSDLGRICIMGSIQVEDLFSIERYETLLQMTSTVSGTLRRGLSYYDIFKAIFPSGSITGAPKIRTMQIIHELEQNPRGVYTGAIGAMSPGGSAIFNVAIRTLVLDGSVAHMGVGGGIVADSDASDEYRECLLKAAFLTRPRRNFQLMETILWEREFYLLSMHIDRLQASAEYFNFPCDPASITACLTEASRHFEPATQYRVKLLLDPTGEVILSHTKYLPTKEPASIRISPTRTSSQDVFLRHKTTQRTLYEDQYAAALAAGFDEVIFLNEKGEVTEGAISNLFLRRNGRLLTPPLTSGVLPGVFRRHLLETNADAEERILHLDDLNTAEAIFLCNSVRGIRQVKSIRFDT